jgi:hypothetical protein
MAKGFAQHVARAHTCTSAACVAGGVAINDLHGRILQGFTQRRARAWH